MTDKKPCEDCPHINAKDVLRFIAKDSFVKKWLTITFCFVCIVTALGVASGLNLGVGSYVYDTLHNSKILETILRHPDEPAS